LDAFPTGEGHALNVSKQHYSDIYGTSPQALSQVTRNSNIVVKATNKIIAPDGLSIHQLNKAAAGQTVFHSHMRLIFQPRGLLNPYRHWLSNSKLH
jgi:histidine triad (HIT) family protein